MVVLAAVFVGCAASTKYTLGLLALPLAWSSLTAPRSWRQRLQILALVAAVSAMAFLALTPGAAWEPQRVLAALRFQSTTYRNPFPSYGVDGLADMLRTMGRYVGGALLSPWLPVAVLLSSTAVGGLVVMLRNVVVGRERERGWQPLLIFLGVFVTVFLPQRTFIARNLLPLVPLLAVGAATGVGTMVRFVSSSAGAAGARRSRLGLAIVAVFAAIIIADGAYLSLAAGRIRDRKTARWLDDVQAFVHAHDREIFLVSPSIKAAIEGYTQQVEPNLQVTPAPEATRVIARSNELLSRFAWQGNDPFLFDHVFGPLETNFSMYPTWLTPHVVVMRLDKARAIGAALQTFAPAKVPPPSMTWSPDMLPADVSPAVSPSSP